MEYRIFTCTVEDNQLYDFLVDYNKEDPFEVLDDTEERIKYFGDISPSYLYQEEFIFFCAIDNGKIIGAAKLKIKGADSNYNPGIKDWVSFVSVDKEYQGLGIGKKLISNLFTYLSMNDFSRIIISGYTKAGLNVLRPKILEEGEKYGIEIIDTNKISFP